MHCQHAIFDVTDQPAVLGSGPQLVDDSLRLGCRRSWGTFANKTTAAKVSAVRLRNSFAIFFSLGKTTHVSCFGWLRQAPT